MIRISENKSFSFPIDLALLNPRYSVIRKYEISQDQPIDISVVSQFSDSFDLQRLAKSFRLFIKAFNLSQYLLELTQVNISSMMR